MSSLVPSKQDGQQQPQSSNLWPTNRSFCPQTSVLFRFRLGEDTVLSGLGSSEQDDQQQFKSASSLASREWVPVHCLWPVERINT
jgi:hypothetical protein